MPKILDTPDFQNHKEEADWWDNNQALILREFEEAAKDGSLTRGTVMKRAGLTPTTTIRLDPADIELARMQAEKRGLKYQTYLKMVIHQALAREAAKPTSM